MDRISAYLNLRGGYIQPTRQQVIVWAFIVGLVVFLSLRNVGAFQVGAYWDDGSYLVLAKSISSSPSYGHMSNPGTPLPTRYPFGFPLLLAPFAYWSNSFQAVKSVSFIATLFNMGLLFWGWSFICSEKSHWWSLAVISVSSLSPLVIGQAGMVMSEPVFTTFMLLSFIFAERVVSNPQSWLNQILLGAFLAYAMSVRTVGIFLVLAALLSIVIRLQWKSVRLLVISIGSGVVILASILLFTNIGIKDLWPQAYMNQGTAPGNWGQNASSQLIPRLIEGSRAYLQSHIREAVLPIGGGANGKVFGRVSLSAMLGLIITCIVGVGLIATTLGVRGLLPSILLFEMMYLPMMFFWPWRGVRLLYPVQPFLVYQFLSGILFLVSFSLAFLKRQGLYTNTPQFITIGVALVLMITCVAKSYSLDDSRLHLPDLEVGMVWLKENSDGSAVVLARNPDNIFLYSDRKTIDYPKIDTQTGLEQFLDKQGVDYILLAPELQWRNDGQLAYDDFTEKKLLPLIRSMQEEKFLVSVFKSEPDLVEVFQVVH